MTDLTQLLGGLTAEQFLAEYWQKKPLLVRGAIPGYECPISPEELAGLACEEEVESRLIMERSGERPWQVEHGPFAEERFLSLPETHWTVLVQEINKHVPEFALLQDRFNFLPNWRLDDVMVSFAPAFGTVGPHADNYDVFLIQGLGRRRWQINSRTPGADELISDLPLRIMRGFEAEQEWVVEPGDLLYLPPGVAHYGVALEDSLSVSVGFRAPAVNELIAGFVADVLAEADPERFFSDAGRAPAADPGEIDPASLAQVRETIRALPTDERRIDRWFGRFITDVRPGHAIPEPETPLDAEGFAETLERVGEVWRSEYCRYARLGDGGKGERLYVAGEEFELPASATELSRLLCAQRVLSRESLRPFLERPELHELLLSLYNMGCLYFPDDGYEG